MKYNKYLFGYSFVLIIVCLLGSCKKFVDVGAPKNAIESQVVFSNDVSAMSSLSAIYSQMASSGTFDLSYYPGLSSDEYIDWSFDPVINQVYLNNLNRSNDAVSFLWSEIYQYIYEANAALNGVSKATLLSATAKRQLMGEAKFIRAFWNFYLVNLWGDIPYLTATNYNVNRTLNRTPIDSIYNAIITDLIEAKTFLKENYVGPDGTTSSNERVRPNKFTAAALLARVYLFYGNWANAESESSSVINNTSSYKLLSDLNQVFRKNSQEAIWQVQPLNSSGYNTTEGFNFILTSTPSIVSLSDPLVQAFNNSDLRLQNWVGSFNDGVQTYYYPNKYKIADGSSLSEYTMVLRLAEQYLIRAEARAQLGNTSGALDDLNTIRKRAGLNNYLGATDKTSLLAAILEERRLELFSEWGHRWFDIKRSNDFNSMMQFIAVNKGTAWNQYQKLYPIPQIDIQNDKNLSQNPGY